MFPQSISRSELHPDGSLPDLAHALEEHLSSGFPPDLALDLVLNELLSRAALATRAGGAALALPRGDEMVCRAATGELAPGLGVSLDDSHGLSGACLQSGESQLSADTELDPRVDREASRRLGIRSIFIVPVIRLLEEDHGIARGSAGLQKSSVGDNNEKGVIGILEVFSAEPGAFPESAQKILQGFAADCARIRNVASELSWHKPAAGSASDDFMPPPLPDRVNIWDTFAGMEAATFDAAAFDTDDLGHLEPVGDLPADVSVAVPAEAILPDPLMPYQHLLADAPGSAAPEFTRHLPIRSRYEGWTLALGALAIFAIIAVSFLIGSRIGWLNGSTSRMAGAQPRAAVTGNPCASSGDPACSAEAGRSPASSIRRGEKAAEKKLANGSEAGKRKPAATAADSGDLVVYEKGKVVFRMKPGLNGSAAVASEQKVKPAEYEAQDSPAAKAASPVVEASSTTKIPSSKSVKLSPQEAESRLLNRVEPKFPPEAAAARRAGTVVLEVQVAEDGTIAKLRTLSGDPVLANAASEAVRNWRYQPYRLGNQPLQFLTDVTLNFDLPK